MTSKRNNNQKIFQTSGLKTAHLIFSLVLIVVALLAQTGGFFYWGGIQSTINIRQDKEIEAHGKILENVATKEDVKELKILLANDNANTAQQINKTRDLIDLRTFDHWSRTDHLEFQSRLDEKFSKTEDRISENTSDIVNLKQEYQSLYSKQNWFDELVRKNIENIERNKKYIAELEEKKRNK